VYLWVATTGLGLVLGFVAGLATFKRSLCWCPGCGAELTCPHRCGGHPATQRRHRVGLPAGAPTTGTDPAPRGWRPAGLRPGLIGRPGSGRVEQASDLRTG
jgi:hypothetical protein